MAETGLGSPQVGQSTVALATVAAARAASSAVGAVTVVAVVTVVTVTGDDVCGCACTGGGSAPRHPWQMIAPTGFSS